MRIALDAMGTDRPPGPEVEGAVLASLNTDAEIILVGDENLLSEKLDAFPKRGKITIRHAPEAITPLEPPVVAVRKKKNSSMHVAMRLVKDGEAEAFISAGNTGAIMVAARVILGSLPGVARPALSQTFPTLEGRTVVLDLGANVDCTARHLCQFAEMGVAYSKHALGVDNPRIALLNIGEENVKGGVTAREAYSTLSKAKHLNFIGNIEPRPLCEGKADVVVCDGFIGNLFLKTSEAVAFFMGKMVREHFESSNMSKIGAVLARKALKQIKHRMDPNEYSGAPLLGVNGTVIVLHGASTVRGIENAIYGTCHALENHLLEHIRQNILALKQSESSAVSSSQNLSSTETSVATESSEKEETSEKVEATAGASLSGGDPEV
ncbi:MAG: phosphate acyltransferase PlsX [Candidatus Hydrogenedens sp.]|nr:phosphate acyltransferase PlsX [Candidatus Hydrogenedens sp.]